MSLERREIRRLAIFMPPRHGKSTIGTFGMSGWYLGNHPDHRVIFATYAQHYAESWGSRVRNMMGEHSERLWGLKVRSDTKSKKEWSFEGYPESGMLSVGIGTGVTGRGANLFIIDDPVANASEAFSPTIRDGNWDWYLSVADTRLEPGAIEIIIMTLWHPDDLGCRIIRSWAKSPIPHKIIRLPALAEEEDDLGRSVGEPLWPERFGVAEFEEKKRKSRFWWDALYRQNPTPEGGAIFKADWFRRYVTVNGVYPNRSWRLLDTGKLVFQNACVTFAIVDPALGRTNTSDDTAIMVCAYDPTGEGELLVLHCVSERIPVHELIPRLEELSKAWNVQWIGIEANNFQILLAQSARKEIGVTVRELQPEGRSKLSRAVPAIEKAAAGRIWLPDEVGTSDWTSELLGILCEWSGMDGDRDDAVDCLAFSVIECGRYGGKMAVLEAKPRPPLFSRNRKFSGRTVFGQR